MMPQELVVASHDSRLVVLSIVVSMLGAFAGIEMMERLRDAPQRLRLGWLVAAATVDGIGTWSMHYTAKLALGTRLPLLFDWRIVVLSLLVGIAGSAAAFLIVGRNNPRRWLAVPAGVMLGGIGISCLHYTAMAAIEQPRVHHYHSPAFVALSVAVAIAICCLSLPLTVRHAGEGERKRRLRTYASILLRGSANPAMHYTAMAGVAFGYNGIANASEYSVSIGTLGVIGINVVPIVVLVAALLTAAMDRLEKQLAAFDALFRQTPAAVAVMRGDGVVVRVNREFTNAFGHAPHEALGRSFEELTGISGAAAVPPADDGRVPFEGTATRKDGTRFDVAGVSVPVAMPDGTVEIYALMRDVTEQNRAQAALRAYPQRLIETQEAEGLRIARELHDEIGQALTGASMLLNVDASAPPQQIETRLAEARSVLQELSGRVRSLAINLRPPLLDDLGLINALKNLFQRYERQTGIHVDFAHDRDTGRRFPSAIELTAYRIVQEALTNVARHAAVRDVAVDLLADEDCVRIKVVDRGKGFERGAAGQESAGLMGMEERVHAAGGQLTITSSPGRGTRIEAALPLRSGGGEPRP